MILIQGIDRFKKSEGTDTLILAITIKMGQAVAHFIHRFLLFVVFYQQKDTFGNFISQFSDSRLKRFSRQNLKEKDLLHFFIDFHLSIIRSSAWHR